MGYISRIESIRNAETAIKEGKFSAAIAIYEKLSKHLPTDEYIYNRLMMLYRKQKLYGKELQAIDTAIQEISHDFNSRGQSLFSGQPVVKRLSNALLQSLGLKNAKGKYLYESSAIIKWKQRKEIVVKKMTRLKATK